MVRLSEVINIIKFNYIYLIIENISNLLCSSDILYFILSSNITLSSLSYLNIHNLLMLL